MIGRLRTIGLDAADMDAEAQFWSALLDIPAVDRSDDWTALHSRDVRLAVRRAADHVPPAWPDPSRPQQLHLDIEVDDVDQAERQGLALGARRLPDPRTRRTSASTRTLPSTPSAWCSASDDVCDRGRRSVGAARATSGR